MRKISRGIPQGSILGPFLFLLYVNDITNISQHNILLKFALFADNTTVLFSDPSLKYSTATAERQLQIVFNWFLANRLLINASKTHF